MFQVQFDLGEGDGPWWRSAYVGCRLCEGWGPRTSLACPEHQFALSERELQILWKNWIPEMNPINPVDHDYDDGWDLPGSYAYYVHFGIYT